MEYNDKTHKGFMFVISSPSGVGKTTIARMLLEADKNIEMSVSVTTRAMRKKETQGVDYYFITKDQFEKMHTEGQFLESAKVFDEFYGTPKQHVEQKIADGKDVLFDIDWQGARQLTEKMQDDVVTVFLLPPSMKELQNRLTKRNQDPKDVIANRMSKASEEISHWNEYDYVLVNYDLKVTLNEIMQILNVERMKRRRRLKLDSFVDELLSTNLS